MMSYTVGALRPATDDARNARFRAATNLVHHTLSQHGPMLGAAQSKSHATMSTFVTFPRL